MKTITVRVLKYEGQEYRRWKGGVACREGSLIVLRAEFDTDVSHPLLGDISRGSRTIEYYWLDRWYNVFQFLAEEGATRLWYCNINTPPRIEGDVLTYIDLDIDVIVRPDFTFQILDLEEFAANAKRYGYTDYEKSRALEALDEVTSLAKNRQFPFCSGDNSRES